MQDSTTAHSGLIRCGGVFRALADPLRLRILSLVDEDREVCVCHLQAILKVPQPTVSRHLAYLRRHGLVQGRKDGLWVHYRLTRSVTGLQKAVRACVEACRPLDPTFAQDREALARCLDARCE
jgi:ArsR family transcriptional regulator